MFTRISKNQFITHAQRLRMLVIPILITQLCQSGLGVVDSIMAGRVSALDLSAVAVGSGVWIPALVLIVGICMATTPLISEAIGQDRIDRVPYITQQALWLSMLVGVFGFALVKLIPALFDVMKVPSEIQGMAREYLYYISFGFPALAGYTVLRCYTEVLLSPKPVAVISFLGLLANIPVNYIFIYGKFGVPAMGGVGCGIASAVVMWLSLILLMLYLVFSKNKKVAHVRFYDNPHKPDKAYITSILILGIPIGISIFFEASLFSFAALIISPLGELALASHQIALSISSQLFIIPWSISLALTIMIGNRYGERNIDALRQVQTTGMICAFSLSLITGLCIYFGNEYVVQLFTRDTEVQAIAVMLLMYVIVYQFADSWQANINGILRGMQDTKIPMYITFFCYWVVALPLGMYLVRMTDFGVKGFWMALVCGLFLGALLLSLRFFYYNKKIIKEFTEER